jgi:hypothetical protein
VCRKEETLSVEQITSVLQQVEGGVPVSEVCRQFSGRANVGMDVRQTLSFTGRARCLRRVRDRAASSFSVELPQQP